MTFTFAPATVGTATSQCGRKTNADVATYHRHPDDHGTLAVALVDGSGNTPEVDKAAYLSAEIAARYGARYGAMPGVLAASSLLANPYVEFPKPDGVIVLAVFRPGQPGVIAHAGDCAAFGFDGTTLHRLTTDHTKLERLRHDAHPPDNLGEYRNVIVNSIARATPATVPITETFHQVIVLLSDGVHARLNHQRLTEIVAGHATDAQACAQALVDAAHDARPDGDNATAAVIVHPQPLRQPGALEGR